MQSHQSEDLQKKAAKIDFYKLHYPSKKTPQHYSSSTPRSKSMVSVLHTLNNEQSFDIKQLKSNNSKNIKRNSSHRDQASTDKDAIVEKYKQKYISGSTSPSNKVSFKSVLSTEVSPSEYDRLLPRLPLKSLKDIEDFSSKNISLKQSIDHFKEEKMKISRLILSHKQSEEIKMEYLEEKKRDLNHEISREIHEIYDKYFKREYEAKFGNKVYAFGEFEKNIGSLVHKLSANIFV